MKRLDEAEAVIREVTEYRSKTLGPEHPDTLSSRANLAAILVKNGKWMDAISLLRSNLRIEEEKLGERNHATIITRNTLAKALLAAGEIDEAVALSRTVIELAEQSVGRLSDAGRELVLLCYHDGLTHKQAAEVLEIPLGTLKSRLHAVLEQLREHLCSEAKL